MSDRAWVSTLEGLELDLDRLQAQLASGKADQDVTPATVPADLGPLPERLRPRAVALHARMREVEQALADALERARRDVAFADRHASTTPRFLDARW